MNQSRHSDQINHLRQAIQTLESQRAVLGDDVVEAAVTGLENQIAQLSAPAASTAQQRKVATILFTDIVGHTGLVQDLDPEENMEIIEGALVRLAGVIEAHDGHVARFQGDGFKAIFGLPAANESDPENAVRAGLGLLETARQYALELEAERQLTGFNVRVGIDTGLVIVGGVTEAEDTITGLVVNLAARLESAAPPGGVLISHHTYRNVRGVFDIEPQEPIIAKGFPEPVPVYLVRRAKPRAFRMGTRGLENLETKTIGRDRELHAIKEAYRHAVSRSRTHLVTLIGEAGVGKSRLAYEFSNWLELRPEDIWYFRGRASQQTHGIPQFLLRDVLAGRFHILDSDPLPTVRQKFVAGIRESLSDEAEKKAHILGAWLGYDFSDSPHLRPLRGEPERTKHRATLYLAQLFAAVAGAGPTVILLDDIHWSDGGSLDTVLDLARRRPELRLLILCIGRPSLYEQRPDWADRLPEHTRVELAPLSSADTRALVAEILRLAAPLPEELVDLVTDRAEGNPFYAEELIKMLIDDGAIVTGSDSWQVLPDRLLNLKIPDTLTGVLQARLDSLYPRDRRAAQGAAVIGRTFWDKALAALEPDGPDALPALQAKEIIFAQNESAFSGTSEYAFKHALLRDVTYETVLMRVRRGYHALVADWLTATAGASRRSEEYAALIGEHHELAGNLAQAAGWYGRAGRQAASTYAHDEAVHYLSLALKYTPEDDHAACFSLLQAREKAYHMQGAREAQREDLARLVAVAEGLGGLALARVALRQAQFAEAISDYPQSFAFAQISTEQAMREGDGRLAAAGFAVWGNGLWRLGRPLAAQEQFETGLRLAEEAGDQKQVANCLNGLGKVARVQGDYPAAERYYQRSLAIRRESSDRNGESIGLNNLGLLARYQGDYASAWDYLKSSLAIDREVGDRWGEGIGLGNLGALAFYQGDYAAARDFYKLALAIHREVGDRRGEASHLNNLGAVAYCQGDHAVAREYLEDSLAIQREIGDQWGEGISLNELGNLSLARGDLSHAQGCYQSALSIRQELGQPQYLVEDWAGLGKLKLAEGDLEGAQSLAWQILDYLRANPQLEGTENPMRTFRFAWELLTGLGEPAAADEVLHLAIQIMRAYLDKNSDPNTQESYLRQPHHAPLWAAWQQKPT